MGDSLIDYDSCEPNEVDDALRAFTDSLPDDLRTLSEAIFYAKVGNQFLLSYKSLSEILGYQGFNPIVVLKRFKTISDEMTEEGDFIIETEDKRELLKISKKGNFTLDLALMVLLFVTRGTNWNKIKKRTVDQWITVFDYKISKYGIISTAPTGGYKKDDLTISRLASCVPHWVMFFHHNNVGRRIADLTILKNAARVEIPLAIQTNMLPPLIPKTTEGEKLKYFCYFYSYMLDSIINAKSTKKHETVVKEIESFVDAAYNSTFITDSFRIVVFQNFGLMSSDDRHSFNSVIKGISKTAEDLWRLIGISKGRVEALDSIKSLYSQFNFSPRFVIDEIKPTTPLSVDLTVKDTQSFMSAQTDLSLSRPGISAVDTQSSDTIEYKKITFSDYEVEIEKGAYLTFKQYVRINGNTLNALYADYLNIMKTKNPALFDIINEGKKTKRT